MGERIAEFEAARREEQTGTHMLAPGQRPRWIGAAVAERLDLDLTNTGHCNRISSPIKTWWQNGVLKVEELMDPRHRNGRNVVVPGNWMSRPRLPSRPPTSIPMATTIDTSLTASPPR
jgi:hypothetical protein